jgi:hypothetical protein
MASATSLLTSFKPITCTYPQPFDVKVDYNYRIRFNKLEFKTAVVAQISGACAQELFSGAQYTEIVNSDVRKINVTGILCLHDCLKEIDEVRASGDIYLYRCAKVNRVIAERNLHIVKFPPEQLPICEYHSIDVKKDLLEYYPHDPLDDCYRMESDYNSPKIKIDTCKTIEIYGICSASEIIFEGNRFSPDERAVIVKKSGIFIGNVVGGKLIRE